MTNVALTTIFTPPPSCFDNSYTLPAAGGSIYVKDISITSYECYPSGFQPLFAAGVPYSPGVCPSGYTYEQTSSYRDDATAVLCCPNQWTIFSAGLGCSLVVTKPTLLALPTKSATVTEGVLAMHGVYVAWASKDLSRFTPASAPLRSNLALSTTAKQTSSFPVTRTTSNTALSSSSVQPASIIRKTSATGHPLGTKSSVPAGTTATVYVTPTHTAQSRDHLSPRAKAGIGVGSTVAGVALIVLASWAIIRRRRQGAGAIDAQGQTEKQAPEEQAYHVEDSTVIRKGHASELSSDGALSELLGSPSATEAQSRQVRVELEGH